MCFPLTVSFRLYDRDGNGVLDSSVGVQAKIFIILSCNTRDQNSLCLCIIYLYYYLKTSLRNRTESYSLYFFFGNIFNQSCFCETGSGPHYCPDDACSKLPWLGCFWTAACEFVCVHVWLCLWGPNDALHLKNKVNIFNKVSRFRTVHV